MKNKKVKGVYSDMSTVAMFLEEMDVKRQYINQALKKHMIPEKSYPQIIHQAMHYAVFNGGKRLRPVMVLEGANLAGRAGEDVLPTACAIEMIHSYSLAHDDLPAMDNDDLRRGKPTCHKVYGEANAILAGDALLTGAFELLAQNAGIHGITEGQVLQVIQKVAAAVGSRGMIGGQVLDLASEGKSIDLEALNTLHHLKTGELFKVSLQAGALLGGMDPRGLEALIEYGRYFGLAFQIQDDILDVSGNEEITGKPIGSDAKNLKTTYVTLMGAAEAGKVARACVDRCLGALSGFDSRADFLRRMAAFIIDRDR